MPQVANMAEPTTNVLQVDACVHPNVPTAEHIRRYMRDPWRRMPFAGPADSDHVGPISQYCDPAVDGELPGSDPARLLDRIVRRDGMDRAVLVPRTRGLLPDVDLCSDICSATNSWLAEEWLDPDETKTFVGSIRVEMRDLDLAAAEIRKWARHSKFVQVAVTAQTVEPLGSRRYEPIWDVLEEYELPLAVIADASNNGIQFPVTAAGAPKYLIQKVVLQPANYAFHLASMLAEGVFERHPNLRIVFADGGHDLLPPLLWRWDKDWRPQRAEVPWLKRSPLEYVPSNVRFIADPLAGPPDEADALYWLNLSLAPRVLMYGSRYPAWHAMAPDHLFTGDIPDWAPRVMGQTAADLYRLDA